MSIHDDARQFTQIPFLATLEPRALELIAFSGETRILRRGEVLFRRGDQADGGFVVLSGRITLDPGDGSEPVSVLAGALVGEMALLVDTERKATATVSEPSGILRIPRHLFHKVLRENPASAIRLRAFCAKRLTDFAAELEAVGQKMYSEDNGVAPPPADDATDTEEASGTPTEISDPGP